MFIGQPNQPPGIFIDNGNHVGLGTVPNCELHVKASGTENVDLCLESGTGKSWDLAVNDLGDFTLYHPQSQTGKITVKENGNVGIGTSNPNAKLEIEVTSSSDKALSITKGGVEQFLITGDGKFYGRAYRIKTGNFPDYVFSTSYKRMSSLEKEEYIRKNNHLPYLPSANEIKNNGLDIEEGIIGITRNVEENTLDIHDLVKRIKRLEDENREMKKELNRFKEMKVKLFLKK